MEEVKGYKAFNKDKTNRYGVPFEEGKTYKINGPIIFGNNGNGYHMCTVLADVFRYVDDFDENVTVAEVTGKGNYEKYDDEYYGYYDMYAFEEITIDKFLSRAEVIDKMLNSSSFEVKKFLRTCRLNEEEKVLFAKKFRSDIDVIKCLLYYHFGCTEIYINDYNFGNEYLRLVLKYGQDSNKGRKRK